jgi:hypothetical protein
VERLRKEVYGTVEEQMAARWAGMKAERIDDMHRRSVARLRNQVRGL